VKRPPPAGWGRYAAPAAFLAVATIAIVLVASALHGQPPGEPAAPPSTAAATATTATTTQARTTTAPGGRRFYTVVAGDTFGAIAGKTGTTVQELQQLNPDVSSTSLHIGQRLRVG
jgi:LysM repeat protein